MRNTSRAGVHGHFTWTILGQAALLAAITLLSLGATVIGRTFTYPSDFSVHGNWPAIEDAWSNCSTDRDRCELLLHLCRVVERDDFLMGLPSHDRYAFVDSSMVYYYVPTDPNPEIRNPARVHVNCGWRTWMELGGEWMSVPGLSILSTGTDWYMRFFERAKALVPSEYSRSLPSPGTSSWDWWMANVQPPDPPELVGNWPTQGSQATVLGPGIAFYSGKYGPDYAGLVHFLCYEMEVVHVRAILRRFETEEWVDWFYDTLLRARQEQQVEYNKYTFPPDTPRDATSKDAQRDVYYKLMSLWDQSTPEPVVEEHVKLFLSWMYERCLAGGMDASSARSIRHCCLVSHVDGSCVTSEYEIDMSYEDGSLHYQNRIHGDLVGAMYHDTWSESKGWERWVQIAQEDPMGDPLLRDFVETGP